MATRLVHELTYEAPAERVAAMLRDPAFREAVCAAQGAHRHSVEISGDDAEATVTVDQWLPTEGVPSFARKIVGEETNIVLTEEWADARSGAMHVTIPGKPGHMAGTVALVERDGTTVEIVDLEIKVRIPVVAGKLEELIAQLLRSAMRREQRVGRDYLAR
jgi:hypothetical protein